MSERKPQPGDVYQIVRGHSALVGGLVYVESVHAWGIMGACPQVFRRTPVERPMYMPLRLDWEHIEYVGAPGFVPEF